MYKLLTIVLILVSQSSYGAESSSLDALFNDLVGICNKNTNFRASSIDSYSKQNSNPYEVEFYERAIKLHNIGKRSIEYLMKKRKSNKEQVMCVDNILNTWPG